MFLLPAFFQCLFRRKMLPNFRRDLAIGHLIHSLYGKDARFEPFMAYTFSQLAFCLARPENLDRIRVAQARNDLVVKGVQGISELPIPLVLRGHFFKAFRSLGM